MTRDLELLSMAELDDLACTAYETQCHVAGIPPSWNTLRIDTKVSWHRVVVAVLVKARGQSYA